MYTTIFSSFMLALWVLWGGLAIGAAVQPLPDLGVDPSESVLWWLVCLPAACRYPSLELLFKAVRWAAWIGIPLLHWHAGQSAWFFSYAVTMWAFYAPVEKAPPRC